MTIDAIYILLLIVSIIVVISVLSNGPKRK